VHVDRELYCGPLSVQLCPGNTSTKILIEVSASTAAAAANDKHMPKRKIVIDVRTSPPAACDEIHAVTRAFRAVAPHELTVDVGDVVWVNQYLEIDWIHGKKPNGRHGYFPAECIAEPQSSRRQMTRKLSLPAFNGEMSFSVGAASKHTVQQLPPLATFNTEDSSLMTPVRHRPRTK